MLRPIDDIYVLQASILTALASPRRLEIVHLLAEGPWEVRRLADHLGLPQPTISRHLGAMRAAGLVQAVRRGRDVCYQLTDPEIVAACSLMRQVLLRRMTQLGTLAAAYSPELETVDSAIEALP